MSAVLWWYNICEWVVVVEMAAAAPASRKSELLVQKIASSQAKAGEGQIGIRRIQGPTSLAG